MKVLIACEESQTLTKEFRKLGIEAYSCDILPCSAGYPEWHIQCDVRKILHDDWAMIIAFPPCTHLAVSGARWFKEKHKDGRQQQAIDFFMEFTKLKCKKVAIENPVGIMSRVYRKPDQIIQPYWFGDTYQKTTCLWLKGLPLLQPTDVVSPGQTIVKCRNGKVKRFSEFAYKTFYLNKKTRGYIRSKTPQGIAKAMAEQWRQYI